MSRNRTTFLDEVYHQYNSNYNNFSTVLQVGDTANGRYEIINNDGLTISIMTDSNCDIGVTWSNDSNISYLTDLYQYVESGTLQYYTLPRKAKYFYVTVDNSRSGSFPSSDMSYCEIYTIFKGNQEITIDPNSIITTQTKTTTSSYNDLVVTNIIPVIRGDGVYGFIPSNFREFINSSGTTGITNNLLSVYPGSASFGYGAIQSFRSMNYKSGGGTIYRFSANFDGGETGLQSGCGALNIGDEISFGYQDDTFGIWHRYDGIAENRTLEITTGASGSENATVNINGTAYTIPLTAGTTQFNAYEIETFLTSNATANAQFYAKQNDSNLTISFKSDGAKSGTYSFTSSTAIGTWTQNRAGVTKTSNFIDSTSWNGKKLTGFNPNSLNNYEIHYKNGAGNIEFFIEDALNDNLAKVHEIRWVGQSTTNLLNPSLRLGMYSFNSMAGSYSNLGVTSSYLFGGKTTYENKTRNPRAFSSFQNIGTTEINILTIRNKVQYNFYPNQVEIEPVELTISNDGTKSAIFNLRANPTFGGTTNYQEFGTNLVSETMISNVSVSDGRLLGSFVVGKGQSQNIDLSTLNIRIPPSLILTVSGYFISGAANDLTASIIWYEDI